MKLRLSQILTILMSFLFWINAHVFTVDSLKYSLSSNNEFAIVTGPIANGISKVIVPDVVRYNVKDYIVKQIGYEAFDKCSNLTAVNFPDALTWIHAGAFYG